MNSFNYSALTTAQRCNTLYKYQYIDKVKADAPPSGDMSFGSAMHLGIEELLLGNDGMEAFRLYWDIEKSKGNKYGRYGWDALKEQGEKLLVRFERLHAKKFVVNQMEQRLYGTIGDIAVEGTPDFIGTFMGKASVVDFKTSGSRYPKNKLLTAEQLHLYAHLAKQSAGFEAEQLVYCVFIKGSEPSIQFLSEAIRPILMNDMLLNIHAQAKELISKEASGVFTKNRASCMFGELACSYLNKCYPEIKKEGDV